MNELLDAINAGLPDHNRPLGGTPYESRKRADLNGRTKFNPGFNPPVIPSGRSTVWRQGEIRLQPT